MKVPLIASVFLSHKRTIVKAKNNNSNYTKLREVYKYKLSQCKYDFKHFSKLGKVIIISIWPQDEKIILPASVLILGECMSWLWWKLRWETCPRNSSLFSKCCGSPIVKALCVMQFVFDLQTASIENIFK